MNDKELCEKAHKGDCVCDGCKRRFVCFTQKRVFSDPTYQALYETHLEQGLSHEDAVKEVQHFLEASIQQAMIQAAREEAAKRTVNVPYIDDYDKWKKDNPFQPWKDVPDKPLPWKKNDWYCKSYEEAEDGIKEVRKYFKDMIYGNKSSKS